MACNRARDAAAAARRRQEAPVCVSVRRGGAGADGNATVKWSGAPWDEREMPEQHSDVPVVLQDWDTFWDQVATAPHPPPSPDPFTPLLLEDGVRRGGF